MKIDSVFQAFKNNDISNLYNSKFQILLEKRKETEQSHLPTLFVMIKTFIFYSNFWRLFHSHKIVYLFGLIEVRWHNWGRLEILAFFSFFHNKIRDKKIQKKFFLRIFEISNFMGQSIKASIKENDLVKKEKKL